MSEDKTNGNDSAGEQAVGDSAEDPAEEPKAKPAPARSGGNLTALIAWLALLVAGAALGGLGLDYLRDREAEGEVASSDARLRNVTDSLSATQDSLAAIEERIGSLSELDADRTAALERIERQLSNRLRDLESLPGRLASVEATMAALQGISTGARDAWLIAEAEYYMQIANAQLQLASNPELAMIALTHADERIAQLADPRLTTVRQALSDELRALEVMDKPDMAGITLTLGSLASVVDSLPLMESAVETDAGAPDEIDPELSGIDRAWASAKNAVAGIVRVREANEVERPLVAPEARFFLRANLELQLQAARLALLRGEETIFRQSLDDADSWLAEYYDNESMAVQSARETIAEIRGSVLLVAMPDISESLRRLRQYSRLADANGETAPETAPETGQDQ